MSFRLSALFTLATLATAASALDVSFDSPVQIPETVLQPGNYKFDLEDRLADRAIVRITEPSGAQHYLLTVPSRTLPKSAGVTYYKSAADAKALHAWECPGCSAPLEFVYPKDEAVKLTAETGKPVLAFDTTYDKLPDNMSPTDRKVVTLWLLSPKRLTADGRGDGLTAAKLTATNSQEPPKRMPKTAGNLYLQLLAGLVLLVGCGLWKFSRT